MTTPPPRRRSRRIPAAVPVVAGVVLGLTGLAGPTTPAKADPWSASTTRTASVSAATTGSTLALVSGSGTLANGGSRYTLNTLAGSVTGYVDLVNTSTVPAAVSVVVATGNLVASTPATVCSLAWDLAAGTCPGVSTVLAQNGTATSAGQLVTGDAVHLRVQTTGVIGAVTLTTGSVTPRPPADRTTS